MNLKTWAPLGAAILLGLVAAKLGRDMLAQKPQPKPQSVKFAQVVVAKDGISAGSRLTPENLTVNQFPENGVPAGAYPSPEAIVGRIVTTQLVKGQPVVETVLAPVGSAGGLAAIIPEGMRALTVEVNETSGVAGMIVPGCRVDFLTTLSGDAAAPAVAKTVAKNILVLACGRRYGTGASPELEGPPARSVTVLATPKEAEVIELASRMGAPRLVLHGSRADSSENDSEGTTLADLRGTSGFSNVLASLMAPTTKPAEAAVNTPATQPVTRPRMYREVQVIKGTVQQMVRIEIDPGKSRMGTSIVDTQGELEVIPGAGK